MLRSSLLVKDPDSIGAGKFSPRMEMGERNYLTKAFGAAPAGADGGSGGRRTSARLQQRLRIEGDAQFDFGGVLHGPILSETGRRSSRTGPAYAAALSSVLAAHDDLSASLGRALQRLRRGLSLLALIALLLLHAPLPSTDVAGSCRMTASLTRSACFLKGSSVSWRFE